MKGLKAIQNFVRVTGGQAWRSEKVHGFAEVQFPRLLFRKTV